MDQPFQKQLIAGDTWDWTLTLSDFPPSVYTLKYFFSGAGKTLLIVATSPDGSSFNVHATPAQTSPLPAGTYQWSVAAFKGTDRTLVDKGEVEIVADTFIATGQEETRSWVKITLDNLQAVLQGRAGRVEQEYQINGRMLRLMTLKELIEAEGIFTARFRREQIESGQLPEQTNQVQASFGDASDPELVRLWKNFPGSSV